MSAIDHLVEAARRYGVAVDADTKTVSWRLFGDSKKLGALVAGDADIQVRRFEKAVEWLSANWPAGAVWPESLPRPATRDAA